MSSFLFRSTSPRIPPSSIKLGEIHEQKMFYATDIFIYHSKLYQNLKHLFYAPLYYKSILMTILFQDTQPSVSPWLSGHAPLLGRLKRSSGKSGSSASFQLLLGQCTQRYKSIPYLFIKSIIIEFEFSS